MRARTGIQDEDRFALSAECKIVRETGEAIVLHMGTGEYLGLNGSALLIVELFNSGLTAAQVKRNYASSYEFSSDRADADVSSAVSLLLEKSVLTRVVVR